MLWSLYKQRREGYVLRSARFTRTGNDSPHPTIRSEGQMTNGNV